MGKKAKKPKLLRTEFRKDHDERTRRGDLTREFREHGFADDESPQTERVSGKGDLTRKRTVSGGAAEGAETPLAVHLEVSRPGSLRGRVLSVFGLASEVEAEDGRLFRCATRRLLKTLSTEQRHVVAVGDCVLFRPSGEAEGVIETVEPRYGVISRTSKGRQHVMVVNVDQALIVGSAAEPYLKPNLIDRLILTAERSGIRPVICINKIDLIDPATLQPLVGAFGQMGYEIHLVSAATGFGIERLREITRRRESVVVGQSGVGKSSLLNAIEPGLALKVNSISEETQKGRHTTTTARLIRLENSGYVVDTPGIRQFALWDVIPQEVAPYFRDLRPFVSQCRFPDCTHIHEGDCAVKDAVADGRLDLRRYESYVQMFEGDLTAYE